MERALEGRKEQQERKKGEYEESVLGRKEVEIAGQLCTQGYANTKL